MEAPQTDIFSDRNIKLFVWYQTLREPLFWGPILISYLGQVSKMNLSMIYTVEAFIMLVVVVAEIAFGSLADTIGRKKTISLGSFFIFIDMVLNFLSTAPIWSIAANFFWAIGYSMISGADSAYLHDYLKSIGRESDYGMVIGKGIGRKFLLSLFCSLACGFLADLHIRLPLLLSLPGLLVACVLSISFDEPPIGHKYNLEKQWQITKDGFKLFLENKTIRWITGFSILLGVTSKLWFFTYNRYFEMVGLRFTEFGMVFSVLNIVAWLSSTYAYRIKSYLGKFGTLILMMLTISLPMTVMGMHVSSISVVLVFFQNITRGLLRPISEEIINGQIEDSEIRATVISISSAIDSVVDFFALISFGWMIGTIGLPNSLVVCGMTTFVLGSYYLCRYKIRPLC